MEVLLHSTSRRTESYGVQELRPGEQNENTMLKLGHQAADPVGVESA